MNMNASMNARMGVNEKADVFPTHCPLTVHTTRFARSSLPLAPLALRCTLRCTLRCMNVRRCCVVSPNLIKYWLSSTPYMPLVAFWCVCAYAYACMCVPCCRCILSWIRRGRRYGYYLPSSTFPTSSKEWRGWYREGSRERVESRSHRLGNMVAIGAGRKEGGKGGQCTCGKL